MNLAEGNTKANWRRTRLLEGFVLMETIELRRGRVLFATISIELVEMALRLSELDKEERNPNSSFKWLGQNIAQVCSV